MISRMFFSHFCSSFVFFTLFHFGGVAQILTTNPHFLDETIFSNNVFFSEKFIRQNKIKAVKAQIAFKRDLQPIVQTGNFQRFEFNPDGRLARQMETYSIAGSLKDTAVTYFIYNKGGLLEIKRSSDGSGFYSYSYEYDDKGNTLKQVYSRDEPIQGSAKNNFQLSKQYIINSETYQYEQLSSGQKKRRFFNDNGMEYKTVTVNYNAFGNKSEEETKFIVTGRKGSISYTYDEYFRLVEKIDFSNISGESKIVSVFLYDAIGNLLQEKISRNGVLKTTREFLYDKNFLLEAQLVKDEATQTIHIYKYSYEFY